ncbi:putative lipoprotein [Sulfitobacter noctilucae]|uniref:hypothetical protein n=1 Tax=Sulfitobacter noctilucae TaxID=1342302 RepID=UPI000468FC51|nr:hypothetical protein [Sulfitobacter noctilucae]KIN61212.1 putative lipoprotein [Sulfitobacter noctilucae]
MRKTLPLLLAATLAVGACATVRDSRVNPFNWFGQSRSVPVTQAAPTNPLIPQGGGLFANRRAEEAVYIGRPFEQVTDLTIERIPGGAIIRATGLAARQGIYEVQLTPNNEAEEPEDGVLIYRLEGVRPSGPTAVGTVPTREVIAARRVTDQQLRGVSRIRVEGQLNAQVARR